MGKETLRAPVEGLFEDMSSGTESETKIPSGLLLRLGVKRVGLLLQRGDGDTRDTQTPSRTDTVQVGSQSEPSLRLLHEEEEEGAKTSKDKIIFNGTK